MYAKTKELGPIGGAYSGHVPPKSANGIRKGFDRTGVTTCYLSGVADIKHDVNKLCLALCSAYACMSANNITRLLHAALPDPENKGNIIQ